MSWFYNPPMKPITIFRHAPHEGPGYFAEFLEQRRMPYEMIRVDQGDPIPEKLSATSALVFMGGPMSVNDALPWIEKELALIRLAAANNMPVLGHCLGGQLISKALGGRVTKNPVREIGWHPVRRIENTVARDWLGDLPAEIEVFTGTAKPSPSRTAPRLFYRARIAPTKPSCSATSWPCSATSR